MAFRTFKKVRRVKFDVVKPDCDQRAGLASIRSVLLNLPAGAATAGWNRSSPDTKPPSALGKSSGRKGRETQQHHERERGSEEGGERKEALEAT